jgi:hypothetical protein
MTRGPWRGSCSRFDTLGQDQFRRDLALIAAPDHDSLGKYAPHAMVAFWRNRVFGARIMFDACVDIIGGDLNG